MKSPHRCAGFCVVAGLAFAAGVAAAGDRQAIWGTDGAAVTADVKQVQPAAGTPAQPADLEKQDLKTTQQQLQSGPAIADPGAPKAGNPPWGGWPGSSK